MECVQTLQLGSCSTEWPGASVSLRVYFLFSNQLPPLSRNQALHSTHTSDPPGSAGRICLFSLILLLPLDWAHCDHLQPRPHPLLARTLEGQPLPQHQRWEMGRTEGFWMVGSTFPEEGKVRLGSAALTPQYA